MFPFLRDIMLALGFCDVSKQSIEYLCGKPEGGNAAVIVVGGAAESLDARPGSCIVTIKNRKGFIRMALKTGYFIFLIIIFLFSIKWIILAKASLNKKSFISPVFNNRSILYINYSNEL